MTPAQGPRARGNKSTDTYVYVTKSPHFKRFAGTQEECPACGRPHSDTAYLCDPMLWDQEHATCERKPQNGEYVGPLTPRLIPPVASGIPLKRGRVQINYGKRAGR